MNFNGEGRVDPALLFFFRNLDLLASEGVLGIVMPDGLIYSSTFLDCVSRYETPMLIKDFNKIFS
jgi:hypothetical protein